MPIYWLHRPFQRAPTPSSGDIIVDGETSMELPVLRRRLAFRFGQLSAIRIDLAVKRLADTSDGSGARSLLLRSTSSFASTAYVIL